MNNAERIMITLICDLNDYLVSLNDTIAYSTTTTHNYNIAKSFDIECKDKITYKILTRHLLDNFVKLNRTCEEINLNNFYNYIEDREYYNFTISIENVFTISITYDSYESLF